MKYIFTSMLFAGSLTLASQTTHDLSASNFQFSPAVLNISVGDIVDLNVTGTHNAIEVTQAVWTAEVEAISNGGFWMGFDSPTSATSHTFNVAGTYYYMCGPHAAMGMKGQIVVTPGTGIETQELVPVAIFHSGQGSYGISGLGLNELSVYNISGQVIMKETLSSDLKKQTVNLSQLPVGSYIGVISGANSVNHSIRFTR